MAHSSALVAHHDTPLIDEPATTRGCGAAEGGDAHDGANSALIRSSSSLANWVDRGNLDAFGGGSTD
jgi:hypothetical protein